MESNGDSAFCGVVEPSSGLPSFKFRKPFNIRSDSDSDDTIREIRSKKAVRRSSVKEKKTVFYALGKKNRLHEAAASRPSQLMCNVMMSDNPMDYHIQFYFLSERIVFINGTISSVTSALVVPQLLLFNDQNPSKPILMLINSPGGDISEGLAIYDIMQSIESPIHTLCLGQASSMGSLLLAGGAKGQRRSLPNATIMIHQPLGGYTGQQKDIDNFAKYMRKLRHRLNAIYSKHTDHPVDFIEEITDRDYFMNAEEAKEFGIIDEVIVQIPMASVPLASQFLQNPENGESSTATN